MSDAAQIYDVVVLGGGAIGAAVLRDAVGRGLTVALVDPDDIGAAQLKSTLQRELWPDPKPDGPPALTGRSLLRETDRLFRICPHLLGPWRALKEVRVKTGPLQRAKTVPCVIGGLDDHLTGLRLTAAFLHDAAARGAHRFLRHSLMSAKRGAQTWVLTLRPDDADLELKIGARVVIDCSGALDVPDSGDAPVPGLFRGRTQFAATLGIVANAEKTDRKLDTSEPTRLRLVSPITPGLTLVAVTHPDNMLPFRKSEDQTAELSDCHRHLTGRPPTPFLQVRQDRISDLSFSSSAEGSGPLGYDIQLRSQSDQMPLIRIRGGTAGLARFVAEAAVAELAPYVSMIGKRWTGYAPLPGGDFQPAITTQLLESYQERFAFVPPELVQRWFASYGTDLTRMLQGIKSVAGLGPLFGNSLYAAEVRWLMAREDARRAEDILWFRSLLGADFSASETRALDVFMAQEAASTPADA